MDKLNHYRICIKELLMNRANLMRSQPLAGEEVICLLDDTTDNYMLLRLGWVNRKRLYSITFHARLVDHKIHIEQDWTDDLVEELTALGVSMEDILFACTTPESHAQADFVAA